MKPSVVIVKVKLVFTESCYIETWIYLSFYQPGKERITVCLVSLSQTDESNSSHDKWKRLRSPGMLRQPMAQAESSAIVKKELRLVISAKSCRHFKRKLVYNSDRQIAIQSTQASYFKVYYQKWNSLNTRTFVWLDMVLQTRPSNEPGEWKELHLSSFL